MNLHIKIHFFKARPCNQRNYKNEFLFKMKKKVWKRGKKTSEKYFDLTIVREQNCHSRVNKDGCRQQVV